MAGRGREWNGPRSVARQIDNAVQVVRRCIEITAINRAIALVAFEMAIAILAT